MATNPLDIPQWVKDARAWTSATKMNQAGQTFSDAGQPVEVQNIARQIAGLYEGMRYGAEDAADQYDARSTAARQALMAQFANSDANVQNSYANTANYQSELAKRLGLEQTGGGVGAATIQGQRDQILNSNAVNRTNQLASYDLLRGGYGELLRDRLGSFDVQSGTSLANLLTQLQAQAAAAAAAAKGGGGGGGGRGGGGGSSGASGPGFSPEQTTFMAINPYNPPSGSTYSSDYVRPDVGRGSPGWKPPKPAPPRKPTTGTTSRAYSIVRGKGNTSRAYSVAHPKK
jgi:hypothetical protein